MKVIFSVDCSTAHGLVRYCDTIRCNAISQDTFHYHFIGEVLPSSVCFIKCWSVHWCFWLRHLRPFLWHLLSCDPKPSESDNAIPRSRCSQTPSTTSLSGSSQTLTQTWTESLWRDCDSPRIFVRRVLCHRRVWRWGWPWRRRSTLPRTWPGSPRGASVLLMKGLWCRSRRSLSIGRLGCQCGSLIPVLNIYKHKAQSVITGERCFGSDLSHSQKRALYWMQSWIH